MRSRFPVGPGAVAFLAIWLLMMIGGRSNFFRDPGTFWHIATGEKILSEGLIRADPFTFTFHGAWWVPYQWLGEVAMALIHRFGGFDALLLASVTLIAAVLAILASRLYRTGLHAILVGAVVLLALAAASSHFHVRPHLFTIAAMAMTTSLLVRIDSRDLPLDRVAWLIPVFVLWTNIHGGVLGGMATLTIVTMGWFFAYLFGFPTPLKSWRDARFILGTTGICLLTSLVNPYGFDLIRTWHIIMGEPVLKEIIQEHSPLDLTQSTAWPVLGLLALYCFVVLGIERRNLKVTVFLPLLWFVLACERVRHAPLFAVVALVVIADIWPRTRWAAWLTTNRPDLCSPNSVRTCSLWSNIWLPIVVVVAACAIEHLRFPVPILGSGWARLDRDHWPVELIEVLREHEPREPGEPKNLFNDYIDGGFVIYHAPGYRVFVDDRCELFGGEWLTNLVRASSERTNDAMRNWQISYGNFDFALTRTGTGFDRYFDESDGWLKVKQTPTASFYRRRVTRPQEQVNKQKAP